MKESDTRHAGTGRPGVKPLWRRIRAKDLEQTLELIRTGRCMSEAAFAQIGVSRQALNRALMWGAALAQRIEDGEVLDADEVGGHRFYLSVVAARGGLKQRLYAQARGIVGVGSDGEAITDPEAESVNARQILTLIDPELRAPAYDAQELEAIRHLEAAKRGDPPEVEETPEETRARLDREAAALGLTLAAPPTDAERDADMAAWLEARGLRAVPVAQGEDGDDYDAGTAGPNGGRS